MSDPTDIQVDQSPPSGPNLFQGVPPDSQPSVFSQAPDPTSKPSAPALAPDVADRTARLAAIAKTPYTPSDPLSDTIGAIDRNTQIIRDTIQKEGDLGIRNDIAAQQQADELSNIAHVWANSSKIDPAHEQELARGAAIAADQTVRESIANRAEYALEQESLKKIQDMAAAGSPTQAAIYADVMTNGGPDKVITDMNTKRLILAREIQNRQDAPEDHPWIAALADFAIGNIPFWKNHAEINDVALDNGIHHWYDWALGGQNIEAQTDSLWKKDPAEFSKIVRDQLLPALDKKTTLFGFHDRSVELNLLSGYQIGQTPSALNTNVFNAIDNFGLVLGSETVLSRLRSLPSALVRNGARQEATNLVADTLTGMTQRGSAAATSRTGVSAEEAVSNALHSSVNPLKDSSRVPLATDIQDMISRSQRLTGELAPLFQPGRFLSDAEKQGAVQGTIDRVQKEFGNTVKDVRPVEETLTNGSTANHLELTMGKAEGGGWAKRTQAVNDAAAKGYQEADVFKDESGQYFWRFYKNIPEQAFYTQPIVPQSSNAFSRFLLNASSVGDKDLDRLAVSSGNSRNKLMAALKETYVPAFRALSVGERKDFAQIVLAGQNKEKWLNPEQLDTAYNRFRGSSPSAREVKAYESYRDVHDIDWSLRNDNEYLNKLVQGKETVSLDTGRGKIERATAIVDRELKHLPDTSEKPVWNATEGKLYDQRMPLDLLEKERLKGQGYIHANLEQPFRMADGTTVDSVLSKGHTFDIEPLRRDQLPYAEGGHRIYEDKTFVKQASVGVQPGTGSRFLKNPNTYVAGTRPEMEWWASKLNEMRLAHKGGATEGELDSIVDGHPGLPTGSEYINGVKQGHFDPDHAFEAVHDRDVPSAYKNNNNIPRLGNPDETATEAINRTSGRMFYSAKGEQLPDWEGRLAPTLDPFQTVNSTLRSVAQLSTFSDFKISSVDHWFNTFKPYLDELPKGTSPMMALDKGTVARGVESKIANQLEAQRDIVKRILNWKTDAQMTLESQTREMIERVEGSDPFSLRSKVAGDVINWTSSRNPLSTLRGMAYDLSLGLFNVARLPIHAAQMTAAVAIDPLNGLHGMMTLFPLRAYLTQAGTDNLLDTFIKNGVHTAGGFASADDFKAMMKSAKNSGFFDINGTHSLINSGANFGTSMGSFGDKASRFLEAGRFFSDEGIVWNQAVAWHIAFKRTMGELGESVAKDSPEFISRVQQKANTLSQSMVGVSSAYWQKGLLSIPTQFWSYNTRMLEMMFGNQFTVAERARLVTSQGLLYGAAGIPVAPFITQMLNKNNGHAPDINTFWGTAERGLVDRFFASAMGADINVSRRMGSGAWLTDTIRDAMGVGEFGPKSTAEMLAGVTGSTAFNLGKSFADVLRYSAAESGDPTKPLTKEALIRVADSVSTLSQIHKAYMISKYGIMQTNRGTVVDNDVPSSAAWGALLGFTPGSANDVTAMMDYKKDRANTVRQVAQQLTNYRQKMVNEPDRIEDTIQEVNAYSRLQDPTILQEAVKKAQSSSKAKSIHDSLTQSVQRDLALEDQVKQQQGAN